MSGSGFTNILQPVGAAIVAAPARSFPNPPTGAGCDVSGLENTHGMCSTVEVTLSAGTTVQLSAGAYLVAKETLDTYPEQSAAVTLTNATEIVNYTSHGFYTGDGPIRLTGTLPAQLSLTTEYWVIRDTANTFQLAASRANALAGTPVAFATDGSGVNVHWVTGIKSTSQAASAIDAAANTYTIAAHGISTGQVVQVANSGGAIPTGLAANTDYYAIADDAATLRFATSLVNAQAGTAIDWSGGSGTQSVIANFLDVTSATVYSKFAVLNDGAAVDLTASIGYREQLVLRPGILSLHLVATLSAFVPVTLQVRGVRYKE
jgi:hypothetical protein